MRIIHIDTGSEMRGGQHQVLLLLKGLKERGYEQVLLARAQSPLWQVTRAAGHRVLPATYFNILQWSRDSDSLVHAHDARSHTLAAFVPGIKLLVSRRVAFPPKSSRLSQWKYSRAKRYLAVSHFVREVLIKAGVSSEKIDVIYDGVETPLADLLWSADGPIVALASRDSDKGRDLMEQTASWADVQILYSDNLLRDLQGASMFIYLTRSEGFGSAALLAMSAGVPVIASRVGGLTEVFIHGQSGLYVENNPENVAAALYRLRNDPELAKRLGQCGRQRIQDYFTKEHMVENTLQVYERVLAR